MYMDSTSKHDWGLIVGGIAVIIAGFIVLMWPGLSLVTLSIVAGVMFLVAGVFHFVNYFRFRKVLNLSGWSIVNAICDIILGIMFLIWPFAGALTIAWMAGIFIIAYGVMAIVASFAMRGPGTGWGWMLANGILSILCGFLFFFSPEMIVYFIGFLLIFRGCTMIGYGWSAPKLA